MLVASRLSCSLHRRFSPSVTACLIGCGLLAGTLPTHAATNAFVVDQAAIATLQLRAQQASPREQVEIYADLVDKISMLASREITEGDLERAQATLHQLELFTAQIEAGLMRDSKGLKKTELMLHTTHRRLLDMVRSASGDMKPMVQSAVARLDHTQAALLSAVFDH